MVKQKDNLNLRSYAEDLHERLKDADYAAGYLNAVLEESDERAFLVALRHVADARGVRHVAEAADLNRESAYRMLSEKGNPCLSSLTAVLNALGLRLAIETTS